MSLLNFPTASSDEREIPEDFIPDSELDAVHPPEKMVAEDKGLDTTDTADYTSAKLREGTPSQSEVAFKENAADINDNEETNSSSEEEVENIRTSNKHYKPFRTEASMHHKNSHLTWPAVRTEVMSVASSTIDPEVIKKKVRCQAKRQEAKLKARRTRKSGESALVTKARRENQMEVRQSLSAVWY